MKKINHNIFFINSLSDFLNDFKEKSILLIDRNVYKHHQVVFEDFRTIIIDTSEASKSFKTTELIITELLQLKAHRETILINIGGGVIGDLGGFVASIFKRGVKFAHIPTTLLAMCDAAIGGKNGINFGETKNIIGTITNPEFVAIYPDFIKTLTDEEFKNGIAEIIKHSILDSYEHYYFILQNKKEIKTRNIEIITQLISRSVKFKTSIVEQDEKELGNRRLLNFGHTMGHALEAIYGVSHGKAVAIGMFYAAKLALKNGYCNKQTFDEIQFILQEFKFETEFKYDLDKVIEKIYQDKKSYDEDVNFIYPFTIGDCRVVKTNVELLKNQLKIL